MPPNPRIDRPSRLAFVSHSLPVGGSSTFVVNLAGELVERGWEVLVWQFDADRPFAADFESGGVKTRLIDQSRLILEDRLQETYQELREFAPDAVIANLGPDSFEILRYLPGGVRRIGMAHTDDPLVYSLHARYAAFMDIAVGVSRQVEEKLTSQAGIPPERVRRLEYGVRFPERPATDSATATDDTAPMKIVYLGRLDQEQKRVRLFPRIFQDLIDSGVHFEWTLVGDGPERAFLERELVSSSPRAVTRFTGELGYHDVPGLLAQQDVFLLASDYEGLPLSLLEAMGAGLTPVVSDLPSGVRDVVDDASGFRIPIDDHAGYARALIALARDPGLRRSMAANARQRVRAEYSVPAMADRWEAVLGDAVDPPAAWPASAGILPPIGASRGWRYRNPCRVLRRILKPLFRQNPLPPQ